MRDMRIGNGLDVHALVEGRRLVLGGIEIPSGKGLEGHSDADVLLHAISDAVLGALCWGDIGQWFPPSDEAYRNADSKELFLEVWKKAQSEGWSLVNCDCVLAVQEPKLAPFIPEMRQSIAELFSSSKDLVSVKATTTESLGFIGRGEGIWAHVVLLLSGAGLQ